MGHYDEQREAEENRRKTEDQRHTAHRYIEHEKRINYTVDKAMFQKAMEQLRDTADNMALTVEQRKNIAQLLHLWFGR